MRVASGWPPVAVAGVAALGAWHEFGAHLLVACAVLSLACAATVLFASLSRRLSARGALGDRLLIVGTGPLAPVVLAEIAARPHAPFAVAGLVAETGHRHVPDGVTCVGSIDALDEILDEVRPGWIVLALRKPGPRVPEALLLDARLRGVVVEEASTFLERVAGKLAIEVLTPRSLLLSEGFRHSEFCPHSDFSTATSRAISLVVAAAGLAACAPLFAVIALALKIEGPGPVFFRQDRIGRGGQPFGLIKFRTMRPSPMPVSEWARDNDERITRVGRWLRRFRLDELPQFINILRGEMNLVGPRPHPACNAALFLERIPYYGLRTVVRPGITGWAQVRYGYANNLEEETEKMRYDLYYIKHRSLWLDLRIVIETVGALCRWRSPETLAARASASGWIGVWPGAPSGAGGR